MIQTLWGCPFQCYDTSHNVPITKQYNFILAKGQCCSIAGKITRDLTTCRLGRASGPILLRTVLPLPCPINTNTKLNISNEKSTHRRPKLVIVRRSRNFLPTAKTLPGGAGWPKFNQLEMVTTFTYKPSLLRIAARNFELSW